MVDNSSACLVALREKSPIFVNDTAQSGDEPLDEEPVHCDPLFYPPEGGAIRRPTWNRVFFDIDKKETPSDGTKLFSVV